MKYGFHILLHAILIIGLIVGITFALDAEKGFSKKINLHKDSSIFTENTKQILTKYSFNDSVVEDTRCNKDYCIVRVYKENVVDKEILFYNEGLTSEQLEKRVDDLVSFELSNIADGLKRREARNE